MRDRNASRRDQRIARLRMPKHANDIRHETQHTTGALKPLQAGPGFGKPFEQLRVNRIRQAQQFEIAAMALRRTIRQKGRPDLGSLTTTFLISMSMPIINLPIERIERHKNAKRRRLRRRQVH